MNSEDIARSAVGSYYGVNDESTVRITQYIASKMSHQDKGFQSQIGSLERRLASFEKMLGGHTNSLSEMRVLTKSLQETVSCVVEVIKAFWIWEERFTRHSESKHAEESSALEEISFDVSNLAERIVKFNDDQLGTVHNKMDEMEQRLSVVESLLCSSAMPPSPIPRDLFSTNTSTSSAPSVPDHKGQACPIPTKFVAQPPAAVVRTFVSAHLQPVTSTVSSAASPSFDLPKIAAPSVTYTDDQSGTHAPQTLASSTQSAAAMAEEQLQIYLTQVKTALKEREKEREAFEETQQKKQELETQFEQQVQQAQQTMKELGVDLKNNSASDIRHARQHFASKHDEDDFDPDSEGFGLVPRAHQTEGDGDGGRDHNAATFDDATSASGSGSDNDDDTMPISNKRFHVHVRKTNEETAAPPVKVAVKPKPAAKVVAKVTPKVHAKKAIPAPKKTAAPAPTSKPGEFPKIEPLSSQTLESFPTPGETKELVDSPKPITVGRRGSLTEAPRPPPPTKDETESDFMSSDDASSPKSHPKVNARKKASSSSDELTVTSRKKGSESTASSPRKPPAKMATQDSDSSSDSSSDKNAKPKKKSQPKPADTDDDSSIKFSDSD